MKIRSLRPRKRRLANNVKRTYPKDWTSTQDYVAQFCKLNNLINERVHHDSNSAKR